MVWKVNEAEVLLETTPGPERIVVSGPLASMKVSTRWLPESATSTRPVASIATPAGRSNCPMSRPALPNFEM